MMSMSDEQQVGIDKFLPVLGTMVDGVPRQIMTNQLRLALIDFCEFSKYWREALYRPVTPVADKVYDLDDLPSHTVFADALEVRYSKDDSLVDSQLFRMVSPTSLSFDSSVTDEVVIRCAVKPTMSITQVPKPLMDHFVEGICAGTAARLFRMPNKTWSDPGSVAYYSDLFRVAKNSALKQGLEEYRAFDSHERARPDSPYW